ncbi:MAG: Unknown protein [uncultured Thiotrichaceae bacterium]|uniref:Uncharacterized protein n=1 Tax=uncultured Thiotrichaceae bacterium TaxID=298394 RepID=A0A6S6T089_9GAMM|nr:MAG: Unknown protein [uncultured Thiotrichaceae bacterium]
MRCHPVPDGQSRHGQQQLKQLLRSVLGFVNFVAMVNPEKGQPLQVKAQAIFQRYVTSVIGEKILSIMGEVRDDPGKAPIVTGWMLGIFKTLTRPYCYPSTSSALKTLVIYSRRFSK